MSVETRRKISEALTGRAFSAEHCAKISANAKGRKASDEAKAKMSKAHTGVKHTPESKAKIAAKAKARWARWRNQQKPSEIWQLRMPL
jgi:hypothetical protein